MLASLLLGLPRFPVFIVLIAYGHVKKKNVLFVHFSPRRGDQKILSFFFFFFLLLPCGSCAVETQKKGSNTLI